jgi:hypothetical protein
MKKVFDFISDPGHGWVKVPKTMLTDLCISETISHYSYMRGTYAYLEEDCDASLFHLSYEKCFGYPPKYRERNAREKQSRIRGYAIYDPKNLWNPQFDK